MISISNLRISSTGLSRAGTGTSTRAGKGCGCGAAETHCLQVSRLRACDAQINLGKGDLSYSQKHRLSDSGGTTGQ